MSSLTSFSLSPYRLQNIATFDNDIMELLELLYITSTMVVGGAVGHLAILSLSDKWVKTTLKSVSFHGLQVSFQAQEDIIPSSKPKSTLSRTPLSKNAASVRGLIASLPPRSPSSLEKSWCLEERQRAIHNIIIDTHEQNPRCTYLGSETFDKLHPAAQIFGWQRIHGKPSVHLGEIARIMSNGREVALNVVLHSEDVETVLDAGWGREIPSNHLRKLTPGKREREVLLLAPRNSTELENVTRVVLEAATWYVAGLDEKEDV